METTQKSGTADTKPKPVHEIRLGRVKATFWENDSRDPAKPPNTTVTFTRIYKNEAGEWKDSKSFYASDLLLLAKTADAAHSHLCAVEGK